VPEYLHDPTAESYACEAAAALGADPARVLTTLVLHAGEELVVCVVAVTGRPDREAVVKRAAMPIRPVPSA